VARPAGRDHVRDVTSEKEAISEPQWRRIALTAAVRDTDAIPKVPDAGAVITRDGERLQVMHNGIVVSEGGYYGAWMTEVIRQLHGHHEPQEELAFHTVLERLAADTPVPTMVELGSFWAYYSMWAKRRIPSTRLVLVEPDLSNLAVGQRNLELNRMDGSIVPAAVGREHDVTVPLTWESDLQPHPTRHVTVDGLMRDLGLNRIDLLLCDVQGAETAMLEGAARGLAERRIRFLVVSTHHHSITGDPLTHQRCLRILEDAGAHFVAEHSVLESCSGDGLIAASLRPGDRDVRADVTIARGRDTLFGELEWDLARTLDTLGEERGRCTEREAELAAEREWRKDLERRYQFLERHYHDTVASRSWRMTRPLRTIGFQLRGGRNRRSP
jgi:FkbM family methyltransferase